MPGRKKIPKTRGSGPFDKDERSIILKHWLVLVDERKVIIGPDPPLKSNKAALLNRLRLKCPELNNRLLRDPPSGSSLYTFFRNFVFRHSLGKADESFNESMEDSLMEHEPPFSPNATVDRQVSQGITMSDSLP